MTPAEANILVTYAGELDTLVMPTDATVDTWAAALAHVPLEAGKIIVRDYYGKHPNPDQRKPITAAHVRRLYQQRAAVHQARQDGADTQRQIEAGTYGRRKSKVPRWFVEKAQRDWKALRDRDPADYA